MKNIIFILVCIFSLQTVLLASNDKSITVEQLPEKARLFLKSHFPDLKISYAKMEQEFRDKSYDVIFVDGSKIEFNKKGEWSDIDCKYSHVPESIIPQQILAYVKKHYGDMKIKEIDRDSKDYEVKLENGMELKFNLKFRLIEIDR